MKTGVTDVIWPLAGTPSLSAAQTSLPQLRWRERLSAKHWGYSAVRLFFVVHPERVHNLPAPGVRISCKYSIYTAPIAEGCGILGGQ